MCELFTVLVLIVLNVIITSIPVTQEISIKEQEWVSVLIMHAIFQIVGFTILKSMLMNVSSLDPDAIRFLAYLVVY